MADAKETPWTGGDGVARYNDDATAKGKRRYLCDPRALDVRRVHMIHTGPHTTASACWPPILKDFRRLPLTPVPVRPRVSPPTPRCFQSRRASTTPFDSTPDAPLNSTHPDSSVALNGPSLDPRQSAACPGSIRPSVAWGAFYTLVPIRPCWRGERRSLRTSPGVSLRPALGFDPDAPRRLSTPLLTPFNSTRLHPGSRQSRSCGTGARR